MSNPSPRLIVATLFVALSLIAPGVGSAAIVFDTSISTLDPRFHVVQAYGEIKDGVGRDLDSGGLVRWSTTPVGAAQAGSLSAGGTSSAFTASASLGGFMSARSFASMSVSNAGASNGYTAIGSVGARTQVLFSSPLTPGRVDFTFRVTGTELQPYGDSFGRLDFLVRELTPASNYFDVFSGSGLNVTGPGTFTYSYLGPTTDPLDVLFYAGAGTLVGTSGFSGAPNGANFISTANYGSTFDLASIDLFSTTGARITAWTLTDLSTRQVVFDQNGRVTTSVPEPGTLALLALGLAGLGFTRRRAPAAKLAGVKSSA